ncbi:GNAT family N-acetyltransferase [Ilyomonas limi]|uniref:GNAT family N-acetyltransferase n=1 Tax=Ilyomonas limi TaxID=2575867 RepID=A0A4U3KXX9_9BACT|nr:GNAT family N-acetyltransferase [Ilyomonas limi]TKK65977.1 GNAT family N-acetyltransferase [Ilyomonas limi]
MTPVLDNPVWHALISGNKALALGTDTVKVFPKEISPIVGLQEYTTANFNILYDITSFDRTIVLFSAEDQVIPDSWRVLHRISGLQMVYAGSPLPELRDDEEIISLTDEHISQMLLLTKLTNPGPFAARTIDFGYYQGILKDGELVAMAGQRLHLYNYAEISAVCTHPHHTGKGYARQLLLRQMYRMLAAGNTPFLHVRNENSRAINVYKNIGFETRKEMYFFVLKKNDNANASL